MVNENVPGMPVVPTALSQVLPTATPPQIALAQQIGAALGMGSIYYNFFNQLRNFALAVQAFPLTMKQADLAAFATKLTNLNTGLYVYVSDYAHMLIWQGTGFSWAPGELGSGYISVFFTLTAQPSPITGWRAIDGSTVAFLKSDGSLGSMVLPNDPPSGGESAFFRV